jgi:hypothetical protein
MAVKASLAICLVIILGTIGSFAAGSAHAEEPATGEAMTIVVAHGTGLDERGGGAETVGSIVALLAGLEPERPIAFIDAERPFQIFGPLAPSSSEFDDLASAIGSELASGSGAEGDLFSAVAEAGTLFGLQRAGPGSTIYLLMGGDLGEGAASLPGRLAPLVLRLADQGFRMQVIAMSGGGAGSIDLAEQLSTLTGHSLLDASSPEAMRDLVHLLAIRSGFGMDVLGEFSRRQGQVLYVPVDVAPGALYLRLVAFKDHQGGSIRLLDPSGAEVAQIAAASLDSPYFASWSIDEPQAGRWQLEAGGLGGEVTVWGAQANGIALTLETPGPVPLGEPVDLVARAVPGSAVGAATEMLAHVTAPDGGTITYLLRDDGLFPDAEAGDKYFSGSASPLVERGDYEVVLELAWEGAAFGVKSQHSLRSQPFPSLHVERLTEDDLVAGERTLVAMASVTVDGQPYTVSPSSIDWELSGVTESGNVELVAREVSSSGEAWIFDVFATLDEPVHSALTLILETEYAGSPHVHTADYLVLSVPTPPEPAVPQPAPVEVPQVVTTEDAPGFPWWTLTFPAVALAALAGLVARWTAASTPVGYLYDDNRQRLVDFSALRRGALARILHKNHVSGRELGLPGLDTVSFVFERGRVLIRADQPSTSIRIKGNPLFEEATLGSQSWIGAGGKAYSFLSASRPAAS